MEQSRILFCDFDGNFELAAVVSRAGYLVDQTRPEALRSVGVGEHELYLFAFQKHESCASVLKICDKLKAAGLYTPIFLVCQNNPPSEFQTHSQAEIRADAYIAGKEHLETFLLEALAEKIGEPVQVPEASAASDDTAQESLELSEKLDALEAELEKAHTRAQTLEEELKSQRELVKPKLKAMLEGEKLKAQTETERLAVRLAEIEARLLDREARLKQFEKIEKTHQKKLQELQGSHEKAQEGLREFYQQKIKALQAKLDHTHENHPTEVMRLSNPGALSEPESLDELTEATEVISDNQLSQIRPKS